MAVIIFALNIRLIVIKKNLLAFHLISLMNYYKKMDLNKQNSFKQFTWNEFNISDFLFSLSYNISFRLLLTLEKVYKANT